jgi:hypothetical protein
MTPPIPVEPGPGPGWAAAAARLARAVPRLLRTDLGRRLSAVVAVTALFAAGVSALYANPDPVTPVRAPAAAPVAQVATTRAPAKPAAKPAAKPKPKAAPVKLPGPGEVAAAWYARRRHLAPGRVEALQQQKVSGDRVRVLVLARVGADRLDTALITVRREPSGWVVR